VRTELLTSTILQGNQEADSFVWGVDSKAATKTPEADSSDGRLRASVAADDSVTIQSTQDARVLMSLPTMGQGIIGLQFSPDSKLLITLSADSCARLWPISGGEPVTLSGHTSPILCVDVSADGRRVVTGSWDWKARVWNSDGSGEPRVLDEHTQA